MQHISVLLSELIEFLPHQENGRLLDVTAGGGGHFFKFLSERPKWIGECWDRDPAAEARIAEAGVDFASRYKFVQKRFSEISTLAEKELFTFILADLGISSFQLDDPSRGLSFYSEAPLDFRMNPSEGEDAWTWIQSFSERDLEHILVIYGEEEKAAKVAQALKLIPQEKYAKSIEFSEELMQRLHWRKKPGALHPLTRTFQALRIAVNEELKELDSFLSTAPAHLEKRGRLGIITFHSLEDRKVKRAFEKLGDSFKILTPKAVNPSASEISQNPRSRSAKLRIVEKVL